MREVLIFGGSGYSGLELLRLLGTRSDVSVVGASSTRFQGEQVASRLATADAALRFETPEHLAARAQPGQVAFLCTPAEASAQWAPRLLALGLRVIDLSGAFRLDADAYPKWYGFEHPHPELLEKAHYGLADLRAIPPETVLVANPGCYATAAIESVAPLLGTDWLDDRPIIFDGKSGTTGAGRSAAEALSFSEVADNLRGYRLAKHQHTPEIERGLELISGSAITASFTPHLVPMRRGILVTAYAPLRRDVSRDEVLQRYAEFYVDAPLVRVTERPPETLSTSMSNVTEVSAFVDSRANTIVAFAAIDNLTKGAAGQALQNFDALRVAVEAVGNGT